MSNFSEKLRALKDKLKSIKHIEIIVAVVFAIIVIAIYFGAIRSPKKSVENSNQTQTEISTSSTDYAHYLETKLTNVLAKIKGAGEVNVIVTLESGFEYLYATEEETRVLADGSKVTTSTIVLVDGKPVLNKEVYPTIKGVVVTSSGADNITVKLNLMSALQTVVDVNTENITILTGN